MNKPLLATAVATVLECIYLNAFTFQSAYSAKLSAPEAVLMATHWQWCTLRMFPPAKHVSAPGERQHNLLYPNHPSAYNRTRHETEEWAAFGDRPGVASALTSSSKTSQRTSTLYCRYTCVLETVIWCLVPQHLMATLCFPIT